MLHEFSDRAILSCGISRKQKVPRYLCDALQPFVTAALTALFVLQLAGLAVVACGLWLRFGGPMAEFATDKKSPELFFMGKLQCLGGQQPWFHPGAGDTPYALTYRKVNNSWADLHKLDILVLRATCVMAFDLSPLGIHFLRSN